jgi:hypothetical protein
MEQKFSNLDSVMEAANHSKNSVMEAENHVKHGASSKSQMSRGDFLKACVALSLAPTAMVIGCGGGSGSSGGGKSAKIKMTTESDGNVSIGLYGSGIATVDWGDGSEKVSQTLNKNEGARFRHNFPSATIRTIAVNGDNITGLSCIDGSSKTNVFTSIDISKCIELIVFNCQQQKLTSLDVSKNTALTYLNCLGNNLTAVALNALFSTLHNNAVPPAYEGIEPKIILIGDNPGANDCDRSIAERKGWTVIEYF